MENGSHIFLELKDVREDFPRNLRFPGGGWEDGESILDCVKREVLEETGLEIEIEGFLGVYKELNQKDGTETIAFMFSAKPVGRAQKRPEDEEEIIDTEFFTTEEVMELDLRVENRKTILEKYLDGEIRPLNTLWNNLGLLED